MVKDSDTCLQTSPGWGGTSFCADQILNGHFISWSKDAQRCCPDSCGTGALSEEECSVLNGAGTCVYPNEAQCTESGISYSRKFIFQ